MRFMVIALLAAAAASAYARSKHDDDSSDYSHSEVTDDFDADYKNYLHKHHPGYKPDQYDAERKKKFTSCRNSIRTHNAKKHGHEVAFSHFCHWTDKEWEASLNHQIGHEAHNRNHRGQDANTHKVRGTAPASWDWRSQGGVSAIKNQGQCGCCYTFAAAAAVEGANFVVNNVLVNVSTQQYVDCSYNYTVSTVTSWSSSYSKGVWTTITNTYDTWSNKGGLNSGCNGGSYLACWAYNNMTGMGQNSWSCYPFTGGLTGGVGTCLATQSCSQVQVANYVHTASGDEVALMNAVYQQPVACSIYAGSDLQTYSSGVFNSSLTCYPKYTTNHAITVVGYGTTSAGQDYWIIKNSWGTTWGMAGFFYLARGSDACSIADFCAYPTVIAVSTVG